jgi:hypothetical protein
LLSRENVVSSWSRNLCWFLKHRAELRDWRRGRSVTGADQRLRLEYDDLLAVLDQVLARLRAASLPGELTLMAAAISGD